MLDTWYIMAKMVITIGASHGPDWTPQSVAAVVSRLLPLCCWWPDLIWSPCPKMSQLIHLDVSWNRGTPKSSIFIGCSWIFHYKTSILGYLHLWKPHLRLSGEDPHRIGRRHCVMQLLPETIHAADDLFFMPQASLRHGECTMTWCNWNILEPPWFTLSIIDHF